MNVILTAIGALIVTAIIVVAIGLLLAWPSSLLWNMCLVPAFVSLKPVSVLQMWGINVLFGFWFKQTKST